MNCEIERQGPVWTVAVLDRRVDAANSGELKARLLACADDGAERIVLDLGAVEFMDSAGLSALVSLVKRLAVPGRLVLCGSRPAVADLMRLTRLDRILPLATDRAAAVALASRHDAS